MRLVNADHAQIYLNEAACEQIKNMPTVDAVEVVRCGECTKPIEDCPFKDFVMLKTDFCSYGERKEGV